MDTWDSTPMWPLSIWVLPELRPFACHPHNQKYFSQTGVSTEFMGLLHLRQQSPVTAFVRVPSLKRNVNFQFSLWQAGWKTCSSKMRIDKKTSFSSTSTSKTDKVFQNLNVMVESQSLSGVWLLPNVSYHQERVEIIRQITSSIIVKLFGDQNIWELLHLLVFTQK